MQAGVSGLESPPRVVGVQGVGGLLIRFGARGFGFGFGFGLFSQALKEAELGALRQLLHKPLAPLDGHGHDGPRCAPGLRSAAREPARGTRVTSRARPAPEPGGRARGGCDAQRRKRPGAFRDASSGAACSGAARRLAPTLGQHANAALAGGWGGRAHRAARKEAAKPTSARRSSNRCQTGRGSGWGATDLLCCRGQATGAGEADGAGRSRRMRRARRPRGSWGCRGWADC
jgi:hypothetical protein